MHQLMPGRWYLSVRVAVVATWHHVFARLVVIVTGHGYNLVFAVRSVGVSQHMRAKLGEQHKQK